MYDNAAPLLFQDVHVNDTSHAEEVSKYHESFKG